MKTIKIFAIGSHTFKDRLSGVDYLRIFQPMKYLDGYTDGDTTFKVTMFDPKVDDSFDWRDVFQDHDIIYFNYSTNDVGYAVMGLMAQKYKKKLVCDVDDDLWNINSDNAAYDIFKKGSWPLEVVTAVIGDVHYVTVTNEHLKNSIVHNTKKTHDRVAVLPNYIDLDFYNHIAKPKDTLNINIGHFGSSSHFVNLQDSEFLKAMTRIMSEYPNVTLTTIGSFFGNFKLKWGARYNQAYGDADLKIWVKDKLPTFADEIDFFVTPIANNTYNLSKSATKFNEISSTKRPSVFQNIRQYQEVVESGKTGYLCTHEHDWYNAMKALCDSATLRQVLGEAAYNKVAEKYTIQGNIGKYAEFFKKIMA